MGRAFTLIELLVVVAIISLLAAILFPVFAQAREKARETACISNTRQIGTAVRMYVQDYDETFPIFYAYHTQPPAGVAGHKGVEVLLQPYTRNKDIFRCPNDSGGSGMANSPSSEYGCKDYPAKTESYFACYGSSYRFTSGVYSVVLNESSSNNGVYTDPADARIVTDASIQYPSETRVMRDEMLPWFDPNTDKTGKHGYGSWYQQWHPRGGGFVFADGHSKFAVSAAAFDNMYTTPDGKKLYWGGD
jgi:prepilin-type N-terminal cleavage/methylation domain-containing protein/prepilin-type processing-associated H-X9-DG protein